MLDARFPGFPPDAVVAGIGQAVVMVDVKDCARNPWELGEGVAPFPHLAGAIVAASPALLVEDQCHG
jgi:hypothetical protein